MTNPAARLAAALATQAPILGVSVGTPGDSATVRIDFDPSATSAQQTAAQVALTAFDWSAAAQQAWDDSQQPERTTVRKAVAQLAADCAAYAALALPTPAQTNAFAAKVAVWMPKVVKRLAQMD